MNFIQGYVDNEINFNREDTCSKQCSDFKHVDYHICRNSTLCILNYLDKNKTRCDGDIRSCEFIESDMHICPNVSAARHHSMHYSLRIILLCSYCICSHSHLVNVLAGKRSNSEPSISLHPIQQWSAVWPFNILSV